MKRVYMLIVVCFFCCGTVRAQLTGDVFNVHDPCIIKHDDFYYIFSTGPGIPIRRSTDLKHWNTVGHVFANPPSWTFEKVPGFKGHIWAPDIHLVNGKYYLYYSISTFGSMGSCIGLAINRSLDPKNSDYQWVDQGVVVQSVAGRDDWNAIDPNLAQDELGSYWLSFGSYWTGIKLFKIDPNTGKPEETPLNLISLARRTKPTAIEAPFIVRHDGFYYLFVSFDQCCKGADSTYKIMVGRSKRIQGPYTDRSGQAMVDGGGTLVLAGHDDCRGPGHNSVLKDGNEHWLVHHMYDAANDGRRTLQIRPIIWAEDGWPLAGECGIEPAQKKDAAKVPGVAGRWKHSVNFGNGRTMTFMPNGKIDHADAPNTWMQFGQRLTLRWPRQDAPKGAWTDDCYISPDGNSYIGRNQQHMVIRGVRIQ
jgi:arabinan endo-1,5-alpha-L-arabinosidase